MDICIHMHVVGGTKVLFEGTWEITSVAPIRSYHVNLDVYTMGAATTERSEKHTTDGAVSRLHYTKSTYHSVYCYEVFYVMNVYIIQGLVYVYIHIYVFIYLYLYIYIYCYELE